MLFSALLLTSALAAVGLAQDIDNNDVPTQCQAVCASVVSLTSQCDQQNNDDRAELNCVCNASGASTQIPLCEACVAQYDSDGRDNDVNDILRSCSFTTTSYNPSAASASVTVIFSSASLSTPAASSAQTTGSAQSGASTASSGSVTQATGSAAAQSTNAAPAPTLGVAGVGLGALGIALGML